MNNLTTAFSRFQSAFNQIYPVVPGNKGQVDKITRNETKLERRKSQNPAPRLRRSITVNNFQDIQTVAQVMILNKNKVSVLRIAQIRKSILPKTHFPVLTCSVTCSLNDSNAVNIYCKPHSNIKTVKNQIKRHLHRQRQMESLPK